MMWMGGGPVPVPPRQTIRPSLRMILIERSVPALVLFYLVNT